MVETRDKLSYGDRIKVTYEETKYKPEGEEIVVKREDVGKIVSKPSNKFTREHDNFDFDYEIDEGAVRSVSIDEEIVTQLIYDAGGDRDFMKFKLVDITLLD